MLIATIKKDTRFCKACKATNDPDCSLCPIYVGERFKIVGFSFDSNIGEQAAILLGKNSLLSSVPLNWLYDVQEESKEDQNDISTT